MARANSTEFDINTPYPVVGLVTEWLHNDGSVQVRSSDSDKGGSMRLGAQQCVLQPNTLTRKVYGKEIITERHRHRYEVNNQFCTGITKTRFSYFSKSVDGNLVEVIELFNHPWFIACQFHPEFTSNPRDGHPLFISFVQAGACESKGSRVKKQFKNNYLNFKPIKIGVFVILLIGAFLIITNFYLRKPVSFHECAFFLTIN